MIKCDFGKLIMFCEVKAGLKIFSVLNIGTEMLMDLN